MDNERKPSDNLTLYKVTQWNSDKITEMYWGGIGSCADDIIVLPEGLTHIGYEKEEIFESDCWDTQHIRSGIRTVYNPIALRIPDYVTEIHIPATVRSISDRAFRGLPANTKLYVDEANPYYVATKDHKFVLKKIVVIK